MNMPGHNVLVKLKITNMPGKRLCEQTVQLLSSHLSAWTVCKNYLNFQGLHKPSL